MVEALRSGSVETDVVPSPENAEFVAPRGQETDEVGQGAVVRIAPGLAA